MIASIKKLSFAVSLVFLAAFTNPTQETPSWKPDKAHSFVNFSIGHLFSVVTGRFTEFDGDFNFDPDNVAAGKASFTINVNSIETDVKARNEHLKTADFFDAKKYPTIRFVSTKITRKSATKFKVYGKLTVSFPNLGPSAVRVNINQIINFKLLNNEEAIYRKPDRGCNQETRIRSGC